MAEARSQLWTGEVVEASVEDGQRVKLPQNGVWKYREVVGMDVEHRQLPVRGEDARGQRREVVTAELEYPQLSERNQRTDLDV